MKAALTIIAVIVLSGCGLSSLAELTFSDWSATAAEDRAERDFKEGKAHLFETGCPSRGPIGINSEDLKIVKELPREHFPCGCAFRSSAEMKLCSRKRDYGAVYNSRILMLSKGRDNKAPEVTSARVD